MANVAIIYYSSTGNTHKMAEAAAEGALEPDLAEAALDIVGRAVARLGAGPAALVGVAGQRRDIGHQPVRIDEERRRGRWGLDGRDRRGRLAAGEERREDESESGRPHSITSGTRNAVRVGGRQIWSSQTAKRTAPVNSFVPAATASPTWSRWTTRPVSAKYGYADSNTAS